jgi:hypothetical protein
LCHSVLAAASLLRCRLVRYGLHIITAAQNSFNVLGQAFLQEHQSLHALLVRRLAFAPLMQLQISFHFGLPVHTALLLQPFGAFAAAAMGYNAPQMLAAVPGMQAVAGHLCEQLASWHELVMYVLTLGTSPQPGCDSNCRGTLVFNQMLVYTNLICSFWLPLFVAHVVELHAKLWFWQL